MEKTRGQIILEDAIIGFLRNQPDKPYIASSKGSWTTHQLAKEIEDGSDVGNNMLEGLLILTADRILRGKETLPEQPSPVSLDTHTAEDSYQKHFDAAKILVPYILSAPRSVGKSGNFEEYILCRDFEEIIENIKLFASQESLKARQETIEEIKAEVEKRKTFVEECIPADAHYEARKTGGLYELDKVLSTIEKLKSDSTKPPINNAT